MAVKYVIVDRISRSLKYYGASGWADTLEKTRGGVELAEAERHRDFIFGHNPDLATIMPYEDALYEHLLQQVE